VKVWLGVCDVADQGPGHVARHGATRILVAHYAPRGDAPRLEPRDRALEKRSADGPELVRRDFDILALVCLTVITTTDAGRGKKIAMNAENGSIALIGPGGAGKSTVGALIAQRLGITFVDLDQHFGTRSGDISEYIDGAGYSAYARENVETYNSLLDEGTGQLVVALSSGFMTYPRDIHPHYGRLRQDIEDSPTTFVLIPSLNSDSCVAETVRRQLARPFARSPAREEAVIRERFPIYIGLRARKIETMRSLTAIVEELLLAIRGQRVLEWRHPSS